MIDGAAFLLTSAQLATHLEKVAQHWETQVERIDRIVERIKLDADALEKARLHRERCQWQSDRWRLFSMRVPPNEQFRMTIAQLAEISFPVSPGLSEKELVEALQSKPPPNPFVELFGGPREG